MEKYVAYYRVSTDRQGKSGLGIQDQRRAVTETTKNCTDCIVAEFEEHESGKNNNRPKLKAALKICSETGATLVIAKLDRLSRNAAFIFALMDKANDKKKPFKILFCDNPNINETMLGMLAVFAEHERKTMSERQHAANRTKVAQGKQLGRSDAFTSEIRNKGIAARKENRENNTDVINAKITIQKEIETAQSKNRTIIASDIVKELNRQQIQTISKIDFTIFNVRPIIREVLKEMNLTTLPTKQVIKKVKTVKNDTTASITIATKMKAKGNTLLQIATWLNENEFKTVRGNQFEPMTVKRLLEKKKA